MTDELSKSVPVDFKDVLDVFEFASFGDPYESRAYLCLDTGATWLVTPSVDMEDVPDDIETSGRYVTLPHKNDLNLGRDLVFSFVDQELPEDFEDVRDSFGRKGAYRRFRGLLEIRDVLDKWYLFEAAATEAALRKWCQQNGIQVRG
jgi:hypothetical protein